jgi:hypothetical protein
MMRESMMNYFMKMMPCIQVSNTHMTAGASFLYVIVNVFSGF